MPGFRITLVVDTPSEYNALDFAYLLRTRVPFVVATWTGSIDTAGPDAGNLKRTYASRKAKQ